MKINENKCVRFILSPAPVKKMENVIRFILPPTPALIRYH